MSQYIPMDAAFVGRVQSVLQSPGLVAHSGASGRLRTCSRPLLGRFGRRGPMVKQHVVCREKAVAEAVAAIISISSPPGLCQWIRASLLTVGGFGMTRDWLVLNFWLTCFARVGARAVWVGGVCSLLATCHAPALGIKNHCGAGGETFRGLHGGEMLGGHGGGSGRQGDGSKVP